MALTSTEEAQLRQLLAQQSALLSLAGNEATITSKLGATEVSLSDLTPASSVNNTDLLLTRQGTTDKSLTALLLKSFMAAQLAGQFVDVAGDTMTGALALVDGSTGATKTRTNSSTALATTAYVKDSLGAFRGFQGYTGSTTLTSADVGKLIAINSASANTQTLPDISTLNIGDIVHIYNRGAGAVTIAAAAGQSVVHLTLGANVRTLAQYDDVELMVVDSTTWHIKGGKLAALRIGSASGYNAYTSSQTFTNAHIGTDNVFNTASATTCTLTPTSVSSVPIPIGSRIRITTIQGQLTVNGAAGDTIYYLGGSSVSPVMRAGDSLEVVYVGANSWYIFGGTFAISKQRTLSDTGKIEINGLLIQWGSGTTSAGGSQAITFGTTYPTAQIGTAMVWPTSNAIQNIAMTSGNSTSSGFTAYATTANTAAGVAVAYRYVALGY